MREFSVERLIKAAPDAVWKVLVDAKRLSGGAFGITRLDGEIARGARLKLWSAVSPDRAFALRVVEFEPARRMVWQGGMPLGLFTGTRTFTLVPEGAATRFGMREVFDGRLSGLIGKSLTDLTPSFRQFADALASAAEARI